VTNPTSKLARRLLILSAATAVIFAATQANADDGSTLEIRDFIGTINWENGSGAVKLDKTYNVGDTKIDDRGNDLRIDGGQSKINGKDCLNTYASWSWGDNKSGNFGGYKDLKDYPVLDIVLPKDTHLILENVVLFTEGEPDIASANIELDYCGDLNLGDISGRMALSSRGSGDVSVGDIGELAAELRGSGDVDAKNIGDTVLRLSGSGNAEFENLASLELALSGSGNLEAADIDGPVVLELSGSGDVELDSLSDELEVESRGSSNVEIATITADIVDIKVSGSGDVDIGGGTIETLNVSSRGSSDVDIEADVVDAELSASGSGDIDVARVTGRSESRTRGSGDIDIGSTQ